MFDTIPTSGLYHFRPPYTRLDPIPLDWSSETPRPGGAVVWFMAPIGDIYPQLEWVAERPHWLPLFIVLPEPEDILPIGTILSHLPELGARGVIPSAGQGLDKALQTLLAAPPRSLASVVAEQLEASGIIRDAATRTLVRTIVSAAPHTSSIQALADRLCQSRRTLGRFFRERDLPVPSHWLQFARILHVAVQIQNTRLNINRVSARFGYTDGFTMSNTMKRLTGYRPSFVRTHLGWEWIVEAWVRREGAGSSTNGPSPE